MSDYERVVWNIIAALLPLGAFLQLVQMMLRGKEPGLLLDGILFNGLGWVMSRGLWLAATAYLLLAHLGLSLEQVLVYLNSFIPNLAKFGAMLIALDTLLYLLIRGWEKYCERFEISRKGEPN